MTDDEFRTLALQLPGVTESSHMNHPDFRRDGKIFATLHYPDQQWGMVKLSPEQQQNFVEQHPEAFRPVTGSWGRQGSTNVRLEAVDPTTLEAALRTGWDGAISKKRRPSRPRTPNKSVARTD